MTCEKGDARRAASGASRGRNELNRAINVNGTVSG